jgi:hypothetical protein
MGRTIEEIIAEMEAQRAQYKKDADEERTILAAAMMSLGVKTVLIRFSGGGDSGQIDDIEIDMHPGHEEPAGLNKKLESWAYKFLEGVGVDWYNNDGGQGEIEFDLTTTPAYFSAYVDQNYTETNRVFGVEEGA